MSIVIIYENCLEKNMIQRTIYVLAVPDLDISGAFYRDALGFEIHEIGDSGWRMFVRDGCRIMAGKCPDAMPVKETGDHSYFGYWIVTNVDDYHKSVTAYGAEIIKPLKDEPWGMREFGLRTVDGHRIMIAQELAS
jgi:predicted enzyme related to lactoylglutathione lyase